ERSAASPPRPGPCGPAAALHVRSSGEARELHRRGARPGPDSGGREPANCRPRKRASSLALRPRDREDLPHRSGWATLPVCPEDPRPAWAGPSPEKPGPRTGGWQAEGEAWTPCEVVTAVGGTGSKPDSSATAT